MYKIVGKYQREPWEDIDFFETWKDAFNMLPEYTMAFGAGWRLKIKKV